VAVVELGVDDRYNAPAVEAAGCAALSAVCLQVYEQLGQKLLVGFGEHL